MSEKEIKIGHKAPLFALESYNKGVIDLKEQIGDQKIVLIFSRYFGCPVCHLDLNTLLENEDKIREKGGKIFYITQSGKKVADIYIQEKEIDFPVIPSTKDELYKEYGLGMMTPDSVKQLRGKLKECKEQNIEHGDYEGWEQQGPGQFVIDENGEIIHACKGWLDVEAILEVL
ncbi:MAG: redoxin domain-containing protein [Candidatus Lokiarchaeota archaeon]|nr:redoxin domain-containing protein [Candidatus Lokiarchaeota archaeon]